MTLEDWIEANPLRRWRKERGMSQGDVARALPMALMTVSNWELGVTRPKATSLEKIGAMIGESKIKQIWSDWLARMPKLEKAS